MKIPTGDVDLNKVETGIPILRPGEYDVKIESLEVMPTSTGGERLRGKATLEQQAYSRNDEVINPGFPIFFSGSITATDKYDPVKRLLVPMMDCFLGTRKPFDTEDYLGQTGRVRLTIREDERFGESNEVKSFIPKGKAA